MSEERDIGYEMRKRKPAKEEGKKSMEEGQKRNSEVGHDQLTKGVKETLND